MSNQKKILSSPRYWPGWMLVGALWLATRCSYRMQLFLGRCLGKVLYCLPSQLKEITHVNIRLCFPNWAAHSQKKLAKDNFISLGIGILETAMAWWGSDQRLRKLYTLRGLSYAEEAFAKGKGIILLSPHFTCLEMVGRLLGQDYAFGALYRPHKNPLIAYLQERFRARYGLESIARNHLRRFIDALSKNMAIWYAYDVDGGEKRSVFAPFFGIPAASLTTVSRMVAKTGAAVIPIQFFRRDGGSGYDIILHPALDDFPSGDLTQDATRLNHFLETAIRKKPEQYIWQYKRFKTRPPGMHRFY